MMPYMSPVYFSTFVLASQFVLVNVVVAVLMKQLEDAKELVSPSASQASGLNTDLENQEKEDVENHVDKKTFDVDDEDEGDMEMLQLQKKAKLEEYNDEQNVLLEGDKQPLLDGVNNSLNDNLVPLHDYRQQPNCPGIQKSEFVDSPDTTGGKTNGDDEILPEIRVEDNNTNNNNKNNNNNNNNNSKDIENTLKDMLEIVAARSDKDSSSSEHLEVDLVGTALALSGLRDSVISTCV